MNIELTPEQIHEFMSLVKYSTELLRANNDDITREKVESGFVKWLEQHQSKPIVVGLTDKQVSEFGFRYYESAIPAQRVDIALINYLNTQTFTKPEVKEIIVGLSRDQLISLQHYCFTSSDIISAYHEWKETQTFTTPGIELSQLQEKYDRKCEEYLKLLDDTTSCEKKLAQLEVHYWADVAREVKIARNPSPYTPDWSNAPKWANWLAQDKTGIYYWYENRPVIKDSNWDSTSGEFKRVGLIENFEQTLQQRATPQVEVGQTWFNKRANLNFIVTRISADNKVVCDYKSDDPDDLDLTATWKGCMEDFIERFERIL